MDHPFFQHKELISFFIFIVFSHLNNFFFFFLHDIREIFLLHLTNRPISTIRTQDQTFKEMPKAKAQKRNLPKKKKTEFLNVSFMIAISLSPLKYFS